MIPKSGYRFSEKIMRRQNVATPEPNSVIGFFDRLSRPLMRALDPEDAHALAIKALRYMLLVRPAADARELAVRAFGLNFPNPVGIAAGFDKNAQVPDALLRLGSASWKSARSPR